ncbi:MAG: hypothetical protein UV82_C0007G0057 [Candidatus Magasanikbacteria bacterium GW2011_GWD2_43_18]|nr:MAG: hypothetical protein UV82_C0007G0057 [Candidatus Magasanikbacteria bacterium GW2011_GWD2_43_18]
MKKFAYLIIPLILAILTWHFFYIFTTNVNDKILGNAFFYYLSYFVYMLYLRSNKRAGTLITLLSLPPFVVIIALDFVISFLNF